MGALAASQNELIVAAGTIGADSILLANRRLDQRRRGDTFALKQPFDQRQ